MLRCFFIVLFFVTNNFYLEAQNTKNTVVNVLNTSKKFRVKDLTKKDTTNWNLIRLECSGKFHSSKFHSAWIINGDCFSEYNIEELEHWVQIAVRDGLAKAQEVAAETMKPLMGGLGNLPL